MSAPNNGTGHAGVGDRSGAPATRGNQTWITWVAGGLMVVIALGIVGWLVLNDGKKKEKEVVPAESKANRWNVPALEGPAVKTPAAPKKPTVTRVNPGAVSVGRADIPVTIDGSDLQGVTAVTVPGSGILFGEPAIDPDGRRVRVRASAPAGTAPGRYRVVVRTATGEAKMPAGGGDGMLVEAVGEAVPAAGPAAPAWIPPLPAKPVEPPKATVAATAAPATGPGGKPVIDPTLARRLTAPISSTAGGGGGGADATKKDGEGSAGGAGGVDMSRSKIGSSRARRLADLTLMLPAGSEIGCVLDNRIQTDQPGFVSCSVSYDVYGADGTVVLIDRGSQIIGEYRSASITYGKERVFVVWSRVRTPTGVLVEIDSPGTGPFGEAGFGGWVDNHYFERVGIPVLMSAITFGIETAVTAAANNASNSNGNNGGSNNNNQGYSSVGQAMDNSLQGVMAELAKIKPTLHVNQGSLVNVLVMKDLDMGPAYRLARTGE